MRLTRTESAEYDRPRQIGDAIAPGRWGQIIGAVGPTHPQFYREQLFEAVRVSEFPDRPSRLTCGFAWIGDPLWDSDDPTEHVYEVVYEGDDAFATHMGFVADPSAIPFAEVIRRARAYWRGEGIRNELLVPGPLRVVAIIR